MAVGIHLSSLFAQILPGFFSHFLGEKTSTELFNLIRTIRKLRNPCFATYYFTSISGFGIAGPNSCFTLGD